MTVAAHPDRPDRTAAQQAALDAQLIELMEQGITFNHVLGLKVERLRPRMRVSFAMRPELVGHAHYGRLHGGVIASVLDTLGGGVLMVALTDKHLQDTPQEAMHRFVRFGTIDLRVDYLRPGLSKVFHAEGELLRLGGRVGTASMRLYDDQDALLATGTGAYIVS